MHDTHSGPYKRGMIGPIAAVIAVVIALIFLGWLDFHIIAALGVH